LASAIHHTGKRHDFCAERFQYLRAFPRRLGCGNNILGNENLLSWFHLKTPSQAHGAMFIPLSEKCREAKLSAKLIRNNDTAHSRPNNRVNGKYIRANISPNVFSYWRKRCGCSLWMLQQFGALEIAIRVSP
jgi:hypothetical protein